jgi:hypothetical protein
MTEVYNPVDKTLDFGVYDKKKIFCLAAYPLFFLLLDQVLIRVSIFIFYSFSICSEVTVFTRQALEGTAMPRAALVSLNAG